VFLHLVPATAFPFPPERKDALRRAVGCSISNLLLEQQLAPRYIKSVPFDHFCRVFFPILQRTNPQALKQVSLRQSQEQLSDADFVTMICGQLGLLPGSFACSEYVLMLTGKGWADLSAIKTADEAATRNEKLMRQAADDFHDSRQRITAGNRGAPNSPTPSSTRITPRDRKLSFSDGPRLEQSPTTNLDESRAAGIPSARLSGAATLVTAGTELRQASPPQRQKSASQKASQPPWKRAAPAVRLTQNVAERISSFAKKDSLSKVRKKARDGAAVDSRQLPDSEETKQRAGSPVQCGKQPVTPVQTPAGNDSGRGNLHRSRPASAASFFSPRNVVGAGKNEGIGFGYSDFDFLMKEQLRE
jgi:hypothetical protein